VSPGDGVNQVQRHEHGMWRQPTSSWTHHETGRHIHLHTIDLLHHLLLVLHQLLLLLLLLLLLIWGRKP
jgi:hypothetical protein